MYNIFKKLFKLDTRRKQSARPTHPKMDIPEDIKRDFREIFNRLIEEDKEREKKGLPSRKKRYGDY